MMDRLPLNQEHKDRLIIICKMLYPEAHRVFLCDQNGIEGGGLPSRDCFIYMAGENGAPIEPILYWLEYCLFHIPNKLSMYSDKVSQYTASCKIIDYIEMASTMTRRMLILSTHPVDVMWRIFQDIYAHDPIRRKHSE